jgi:hypothetical protein
VVDNGNVEPGGTQSRQRVAAAGVDDDDLNRLRLRDERAHGVHDAGLVAEAEDAAGEFGVAVKQARFPSARC